MSNKVQRLIRQKLDGQEVRNQHRQAARKSANLIKKVQACVRKGEFEELDSLMAFLRMTGLRYTRDSVYGMTLIHLAGARVIPYRPDGRLDRGAPRRTRGKKDPIPQMDLFPKPEKTDAGGASSTSAS